MVHVAPNLQLARTWTAFILPLFNLFCVRGRARAQAVWRA